MDHRLDFYVFGISRARRMGIDRVLIHNKIFDILAPLVHMRTGAKNVRARPFSRARGCFHIVTCIVEIMHGKTKYSMTIYLTTTKIGSHIGACKCAQEPKTRVRGRFRILKRILEIGHGKTKYSLTIYLTTKKISATSEAATFVM